MRPRRAGVVAVVAIATLAGCSSAGPAPGRSGGSKIARPTGGSASVSAPGTADASTGMRDAAPSATASSATASAVTSAPTPSSAPRTSAGPRSTCTSLMIRVIRGSAAQGVEFAALQFANNATTRCVLNGYPTVSLLRAGSSVGQVSTPADGRTSRFVLEPGETAESLLRDFSSCQAPLSDQIRVVAPGSSITVVRPAQLRACSLQVSALATPE